MVIDMTEEDWREAESHYAAESEARYLQRACEIRTRCFSEETAIGMLRLRENATYKERRSEYEAYLPGHPRPHPALSISLLRWAWPYPDTLVFTTVL